MIRFGILQGRLSPAPAGRPQAFPWHTWPDEFARARTCGFDAVEWLVTADRIEQNPVWTSAGLDHIRRVSEQSGVPVHSICADCFMAAPLVGAGADLTRGLRTLQQLLSQAARLGATTVLLPVIEGNALAGRRDAEALVSALGPALEAAGALGVHVALESDWLGEHLAALLAGAGQPALGAYYDIGNAAALGRDAAADLRALGPFLRGVHLKDRRRGGGSVPLGEGDADIKAAGAALAEIGYDGVVVLETPVGPDPLAAADANLSYARHHLAGPALASP